MKHDCVIMNSIFSRNGMSLERLMTLERVVGAGGIAVAAGRDPTLASQMSRQIGELEKALGVPLLDRTKKPHEPTPFAKALAGTCGRFLREVEELSAEAQGLESPMRVGAGELIIREVLIPYIRNQRRQLRDMRWVMCNLPGRMIQEGLAAERLEIGLAAGLEPTSQVEVLDLFGYGMKLLLPDGQKADKTGWKRLAKIGVVMIEGDSRFRRFLSDCSQRHGVSLSVTAECTSHPQAVDLAEASGLAVFVPEYWWKRRKDWLSRTHFLPGLDAYRRTLRLGWNQAVLGRRNEVDMLVKLISRRG